MSTYLNRTLNTPVPQTEPLDDRMVPNNAGGYSYPVTDEVRMHRFLIIGSEDGSYYQKERKLTLDNINATKRHIAANGPAAVEHIVDVATARRAPRVSPTLFCLAAAASADDVATRQAALQALPRVANTASHLEEFTSYVDSMRRWGRSLRNAVSTWYTSRDASQVAFQAVKYRTRAGWSHRDLLCKAHPQAEKDSDLWHVFEWIVNGTVPPDRPAPQHHPHLPAGPGGDQPGRHGCPHHQGGTTPGGRAPHDAPARRGLGRPGSPDAPARLRPEPAGPDSP